MRSNDRLTVKAIWLSRDKRELPAQHPTVAIKLG
jgi:hypothetical protein